MNNEGAWYGSSKEAGLHITDDCYVSMPRTTEVSI